MTNADIVPQILMLVSVFAVIGGLWMGLKTRRTFTREFVTGVGIKIVPILVFGGAIMAASSMFFIVGTAGMTELSTEGLELLFDAGLFACFLGIGLGIGPRQD
jgi:hypothetical protein